MSGTKQINQKKFFGMTDKNNNGNMFKPDINKELEIQQSIRNFYKF